MEFVREKAWKSLISGAVPDSWAHLTALKVHYQLGDGAVLASVQSLDSDVAIKQEILEIWALQACLCELMGDAANSERLIAHVRKELVSGAVPVSFYLAYAMGRLAYRRGDYSPALEHFLRASQLALSQLHQVWALGNISFCYWNLGLPYEGALQQTEALLQQLPVDEPTLPRISTQISAQRLRDLFYRGEIEACLSDEGKAASATSQHEYLRMWIRSLPYHCASETSRNGISGGAVRLISENSRLDFSSFRFRTLQGLVHPEDSHISKPTERVDRLYLWVWRWLCDIDSMPASKLATTLENLRLQDVELRLTREDRQLLRNALAWIGLFDPAAERRLHGVTEELRSVAGEESPLLKFEFWVCQYWRALRRGEEEIAEDLLQCLRRHELWGSNQLYLAALLPPFATDRTGPDALRGLKVNLREFLPRKHLKPAAVVKVDFRTNEIFDTLTGRKVYSEPMVRALDLLRDQENVSCEEFIDICFGIPEFDSLIHGPKIFNLLSRLKKVSGQGLNFRTKSGRVFCEGSWNGIEFVNSRSLPKLGRWITDARPAPKINKNKPLEPVSLAFHSLAEPPYWEGFLNREGIERLVSRPRSTTNRLLSRWIDSGRVHREGKRKLARYCLVRNP